jgi:hypothetical protein
MKSPCSLCVCVSSISIIELEETAVARQRLSKHVSAATNTHATIEEMLEAVISMRYMSLQMLCSEKKVGDYLFPELTPISFY